MFFPESRVRVWLYTRPTDMRKSFDGLVALVAKYVESAKTTEYRYEVIDRDSPDFSQVDFAYFEGYLSRNHCYLVRFNSDQRYPKILEVIENLTFWVNVYSETSPAHITALGDLVLTVLDNASLTVSGYTAMVCRREFMGSITFDGETRVFQLPMRYRVMISL